MDYEAELAVVIGRGGRDISREDALNHVFGYTIANDITARDLQRRHNQWFKGKCVAVQSLSLCNDLMNADSYALQGKRWIPSVRWVR